jgi:hypothetical protein
MTVDALFNARTVLDTNECPGPWVMDLTEDAFSELQESMKHEPMIKSGGINVVDLTGVNDGESYRGRYFGVMVRVGAKQNTMASDHVCRTV